MKNQSSVLRQRRRGVGQSNMPPRQFVTESYRYPRRTVAGTQLRIVEAAQQELVSSGHHQFKMRDIAERCGISVGNLTYHFPTKKCLLMAVVDHVCESYLNEFHKLLSPGLGQESISIESFAEHFLRDAATLKTSRLYRELWAMSSHYPEVHAKVADLYNKLSDGFVCHVSEVYPGLPRHTLEAIICLLGILTEGTTVLYGSRYGLPIDDSEMLPIMVSVFSKYVKGVTS